METHEYLHGYTPEEQARLVSQNETLSEFIYNRIDLNGVQHLLEVGVGVGAQMAYILKHYPHIFITGVDISSAQLATAKKMLDQLPYAKNRYALQLADATGLPFDTAAQFDGAFLCWVLEHTPNPKAIVQEIKRVLRPNSPIVITEVMHNSLQLAPVTTTVKHFWQKMIDFQYTLGGDANIGLLLGQLLHQSAYKEVEAKPYAMFFDERDTQRRHKMLVYWRELMRSAVPNMVEANYCTLQEWQAAEKEMNTLLENDTAIFYYTFIQAWAKS